MKNIILILLFFFSCAVKAAEVDERAVTVMASSSLTEALTEVARNYSINANVTINVSYGSTADLSKKISEGESADLFIAEQTKWTAELTQKGLIDIYSVKNLFKNSLVLVADKENSFGRRINVQLRPEDILKGISEKVILVLVDEETDPLGVFTKNALEKLGYWQKIKPMSLRANNSVNAMYLISKGESAGIAYASDVFMNNEIKILSKFDEGLTGPIIYQAGVIAGENMALARDFLGYLKSDEAKGVFERYGFIAL